MRRFIQKLPDNAIEDQKDEIIERYKGKIGL